MFLFSSSTLLSFRKLVRVKLKRLVITEVVMAEIILISLERLNIWDLIKAQKNLLFEWKADKVKGFTHNKVIYKITGLHICHIVFLLLEKRNSKL